MLVVGRAIILICFVFLAACQSPRPAEESVAPGPFGRFPTPAMVEKTGEKVVVRILKSISLKTGVAPDFAKYARVFAKGATLDDSADTFFVKEAKCVIATNLDGHADPLSSTVKLAKQVTAGAYSRNDYEISFKEKASQQEVWIRCYSVGANGALTPETPNPDIVNETFKNVLIVQKAK